MNHGLSILFRAIPLLMAAFCFSYGAYIYGAGDDHSGLVPHETLFIDDGRKNVNAARDLGFDVYMPAPREDFRHLFDDLLPG